MEAETYMCCHRTACRRRCPVEWWALRLVLGCLLAAVDRGNAASIAGWFELGHLADWRAAGLAVPAVLQPDGPVAERGAGD
jgi:hypothetical protein